MLKKTLERHSHPLRQCVSRHSVFLFGQDGAARRQAARELLQACRSGKSVSLSHAKGACQRPTLRSLCCFLPNPNPNPEPHPWCAHRLLTRLSTKVHVNSLKPVLDWIVHTLKSHDDRMHHFDGQSPLEVEHPEELKLAEKEISKAKAGVEKAERDLEGAQIRLDLAAEKRHEEPDEHAKHERGWHAAKKLLASMERLHHDTVNDWKRTASDVHGAYPVQQHVREMQEHKFDKFEAEEYMAATNKRCHHTAASCWCAAHIRHS